MLLAAWLLGCPSAQGYPATHATRAAKGAALFDRPPVTARTLHFSTDGYMASATRVFDAVDGKPNASEEKKEAELRRMKDVIAEITAENLELKKGLSG